MNITLHNPSFKQFCVMENAYGNFKKHMPSTKSEGRFIFCFLADSITSSSP